MIFAPVMLLCLVNSWTFRFILLLPGFGLRLGKDVEDLQSMADVSVEDKGDAPVSSFRVPPSLSPQGWGVKSKAGRSLPRVPPISNLGTCLPAACIRFRVQHCHCSSNNKFRWACLSVLSSKKLLHRLLIFVRRGFCFTRARLLPLPCFVPESCVHQQ